MQCVRRFEPGFEVTPDNRAALVEICTRLDGLPLALELAAARLKLFTPGELTFRLRHRMSILIGTVRDVPPRHRTLRAALAWSHDLLKPDERAAFRRLSVFAGGATLEAAGQVCALGDPVATITSLVDKSLLQRRIRPDGVAEFVMLESLREYAGVLLAEHGEQEEVEARHARYFADLAILVDTAVGEAAGRSGRSRSASSRATCRKALAYAMAVADAGLSLPLAAILGWYASVPARGQAGATRTAHRAVVDPGHRRAGGRLAEPRPAGRRRTGPRAGRSRRRRGPARPRARGRRRPAVHGDRRGRPGACRTGPRPSRPGRRPPRPGCRPVRRAREPARSGLVAVRPGAARPSPAATRPAPRASCGRA